MPAETVPNLAGILDRNGVLCEFNQEAAEVVGVERADTIGRKLWDCCWWNESTITCREVRKQFEEAISGETVTLPVLAKMSKTRLSAMNLTMTPVVDCSGIVSNIVVSGVVVSQKQILKSRKASTLDHLKRALSAAKLGTWEWSPVQDSIQWSPRLFEIFGVAEQAFSGRLWGFLKLIHSEDRNALIRKIRSVIDGNEDSYEIECRIVRPSDFRTAWIHGRAIIQRDPTGRPIGMTGVASEITERKEYEIKIAAAKDRLDVSLESGQMAPWHWDPDSDEIVANPMLNRIFGFEIDDDPSFGRFVDRIVESDRQRVVDAIGRSMKNGGEYDEQYAIRWPEGTLKHVRARGRTRLSSSGKMEDFFGVVVDVTAEHDAAEALKASERLANAASESKSEFLANMSHEIRTPMSAILGYADILDRSLQNQDDLNCVSIIRNNGKFLLDIINDILDISKVEAGKIEIQRKTFRLDKLVEDIRALMQVRAIEKDLKFSVEVEGLIPQEVKSDSKRLKQILVNLVGNAIKFTDSGSVMLTIKYHRNSRGGRLQFDVVDTGIGMSEDQQQGLFQPFSQGDSSVDRQFGGTGLGLAISQRLAQMLNGEIVLESALGEGSTFTLFVDADTADDVATIGTSDLSLKSASSQVKKNEKIRLDGFRILVVDDQRDIRYVAQSVIENAGGFVETGENGLEALNSVSLANQNGNPFEVVILDMQMPLMDGYEAARQLRSTGFQKPIIALTAHAMEGDRDACLEAGCTDYLTKPLDSRVFLRSIKSCLIGTNSEDTSAIQRL